MAPSRSMSPTPIQAQSLDGELVLTFQERPPDCIPWFIVCMGLPQKQEISHRVQRSSHYSCVWRHVQPHMILIKSCKCASAAVSMFFFTFILFFCVLCMFALLCEACPFLNPLFSQTCGMQRKWGWCFSLKSSWLTQSVLLSCHHSSVTHKTTLVLTEGCKALPCMNHSGVNHLRYSIYRLNCRGVHTCLIPFSFIGKYLLACQG